MMNAPYLLASLYFPSVQRNNSVLQCYRDEKGRAAPMNRAKSLNSSNVGEKMGMCFMLGVGWLSRPVAPLSASIAGSLCQHGL